MQAPPPPPPQPPQPPNQAAPATTTPVAPTSHGGEFRPVRERDYFVEDARRVAAFIKQRTAQRPEIAVVVGARLKGFELLIEDEERVTFEELQAHFPRFPTCSMLPGPAGAFVFGAIDGVPVLVMLGRFHLYEGHSAQATAFPIRVMKELGVQTLILTNAARGLSPTLQIGDVMLIVDHYNTERDAAAHPLAGMNVAAHGPRFLRCDALYDGHLRRLTRRVAKRRGIALKQGGYVFVSGPAYDTPMEEAGLRRLCELRGAWGRALMHLQHWLPRDARGGESAAVRMLDRALNRLGLYDTAVGMSTVPEVLVADHCGLRVLAISGIYFMCKEGTQRLALEADAARGGPRIAHYQFSDSHDRRAQFELRRRQEEERRQEEIAPKMTALIRGVLQALGDTADIDMELDIRAMTRWQIPTKLCVSWTRIFCGAALAGFTLTLASTALVALAAGRGERQRGGSGRW